MGDVLVSLARSPRTTRVTAGDRVTVRSAQAVQEWVHSTALPIPNTVTSAGEAPGELVFVADRDGAFRGDFSAIDTKGKHAGTHTVELRRGPLSRLGRRAAMWLGLMLGLAAYGVMALVTLGLDAGQWAVLDGGGVERESTNRAVIFATATLLAVGLVLHAASKGSGGGGLLDLVRGTDRRTSTSKIQYLLWTFGIAFALCFIGARAIIDDETLGDFVCEVAEDGVVNPRDQHCVDPGSWDTYLILLGLPAAAAVVAKGITVRKVENGTLQKTTASSGETGADQAFTDDNGKADIADVQYLIFNLITFVFVAAVFLGTGVLGEVPEILLGLTGAAGATYVLNKGLQSNVPVVQSVVPSVIVPTDVVDITGTNLFPPGAGAERHERAVLIGGVPAAFVDRDVVAGWLQVRAPLGMDPQEASVAVVTAAGVQTQPFRVVVQPDPEILGCSVPVRAKGSMTVDVYVQGLPGTVAPGTVLVEVGGSLAGSVTPLRPGILRATVPDPGRGTFPVVLRHDGRTSKPVHLVVR